nr:MAG TPA: hypothetical protein [Caudoviricetes sp.]
MQNPILQNLGQVQEQTQTPTAQAPANNGGDAIAQAAAQAQKLMGNAGFMQAILSSVGGRNPQQLFYALCKQKGIDPQAILAYVK